MVFFELLLDVWGLSRVTRGTQRASGVAPRKYNLNSSCKWECGIALESQQGNLASRCVEGGILRSFSNCSRKPWVRSSCDGDLTELLRVPMGNQKYCGFGMGLSGLHWIWYNGKGPHLELRQEPQSSSAVLTWVSGCVCCFKQGVRSRRVWRHGTLLFSRVVKEFLMVISLKFLWSLWEVRNTVE